MTQKIALVTGGNRGIGFEIARQLSAQNIIVILTARQLGDAQQAALAIGTADMPVYPLKLDVTQDADIRNAIQFVEQKFAKLDILVNNAGVFLEEGRQDIDLLRQTLEANTIAPYAITQAFLPLLKKSPAGRIVNQSSQMGSLSICSSSETAYDLYPAYSASKAALNMLTVIQTRQLKDTNIKVNAAHPGWVKTRMGGDEAPLSPQEGAKTAVRLALLPDDGPTGKFFHLDEELPW